jgi:hypothetical protein
MRPSNPATFFTAGGEQSEYLYDPGPDPYYVILHGKSYIPLSVIVFAAGEAHAVEIVRGMVDHKEACLEEFLRRDGTDRHGVRASDRSIIKTLRAALEGLDGYTVSVGPVEKGQLHKVGWAGNDTI